MAEIQAFRILLQKSNQTYVNPIQAFQRSPEYANRFQNPVNQLTPQYSIYLNPNGVRLNHVNYRDPQIFQQQNIIQNLI